jgi:hypothetical protein
MTRFAAAHALRCHCARAHEHSNILPLGLALAPYILVLYSTGRCWQARPRTLRTPETRRRPSHPSCPDVPTAKDSEPVPPPTALSGRFDCTFKHIPSTTALFGGSDFAA